MTSNKKDLMCHNCQGSDFALLDGLFFCETCGVQYENLIEMEHDTFHGQIQSKIATGAAKKKQSNRLLTSWEEYNFILIAMMEQIQNIEAIPGFRMTCLQLWISFLRTTEAAFFSKDLMAPKLFATYRPADAEILYNKKPKKRIRGSEKAVVPLNEEETARSRRKKMKKSEKVISTQLSESEKAESFNSSLLVNMSIESIMSEHDNLEPDIEFSSIAKRTRMYTGTDSEKSVLFTQLRRCERTNVLSSLTLFNIIYCALNFCKSDIQLSDLIRFVREGHLTFFNPRSMLPEEISENDFPLSLQKYHNFHMLSYNNQVTVLAPFIQMIPDLSSSFITPDITQLIRRFLIELNLPSDLGDYLERLIAFYPNPKFSGIPPFNYEGRAMAYIIFILKLLFGLDGCREEEISRSARKINKKFNENIFVYEDWKKFMEYRNFMLQKFHFPSAIFSQNDSPQVYDAFNSMLQALNPKSINAQKVKASNEKLVIQRLNTQDLAKELLQNHEATPMSKFTFNSSFTPLHDSFQHIHDHSENIKLHEKIAKYDSDKFTCDLLLNPKKLKEQLSYLNIAELHVKRSSFPKVFKLKQFESLFEARKKGRKFELTSQLVDYWRQELMHEKEIETEKIRKAEKFKQRKWMEKVMKKREMWREKIAARRQRRIDKESRGSFEGSILGDVSDDEEEENRFEDIDFEGLDHELDDIFKSYEQSRLTFVVPDYNFWHYRINVNPFLPQSNRKEFDKLPKSFQWLLKLASDVCHQPQPFIYLQLCVIEKEMLNYVPTELMDNVLLTQNYCEI